MSTVAIKEPKVTHVTIVKKVKDYSKAPAFKKKAEAATAFLKKHGIPDSFKKNK